MASTATGRRSVRTREAAPADGVRSGRGNGRSYTPRAWDDYSQTDGARVVGVRPDRWSAAEALSYRTIRPHRERWTDASEREAITVFSRLEALHPITYDDGQDVCKRWLSSEAVVVTGPLGPSPVRCTYGVCARAVGTEVAGARGDAGRLREFRTGIRGRLHRWDVW